MNPNVSAALRGLGVETDLKRADDIHPDAFSSIFDLSRPKPRKIAQRRYGKALLKRMIGLGSRFVVVVHVPGASVVVPIGDTHEKVEAAVLRGIGLRRYGVSMELHLHASAETSARIEKALLAQEMSAAECEGRA